MHLRATARRLRHVEPDASGDRYVNYGWINLLFSDDNDLQELYYHANCEEYYANDLPIYGRLLKAGDVAIDVGANLGWTATLMASIVGHSGRVFAFEPSKRTFTKLRKTIAANYIDHIVTPLNLACGSRPGAFTLNHISPSSGKSTLVRSVDGAATEIVEVVQLDSIAELQSQQVALIKTDTEGFESAVLEGAERLIRRDKPFIYLEMGGDYPEETRESLRILDRLDYCLNVPKTFKWENVGGGSDFVAFHMSLTGGN
jgi:FkbM family methyltransferase